MLSPFALWCSVASTPKAWAKSWGLGEELARFADRVLVLSGESVVASGAPRDVLTPQLFAQAFGVDATLHQSANGDSMLEVRGATTPEAAAR